MAGIGRAFRILSGLLLLTLGFFLLLNELGKSHRFGDRLVGLCIAALGWLLIRPFGTDKPDGDGESGE